MNLPDHIKYVKYMSNICLVPFERYQIISRLTVLTWLPAHFTASTHLSQIVLMTSDDDNQYMMTKSMMW